MPLQNMSRFYWIPFLMALEVFGTPGVRGSSASLNFPNMLETQSPHGLASAPINTESHDWESLNSTNSMGKNSRLRQYPKQGPLLLFFATSAVTSALIFLALACYHSLIGNSHDHDRRLSGSSDDCSTAPKRKRAAKSRRKRDAAAAAANRDVALDATLDALEGIMTSKISLIKPDNSRDFLVGWKDGDILNLQGHITEFSYDGEDIIINVDTLTTFPPEDSSSRDEPLKDKALNALKNTIKNTFKNPNIIVEGEKGIHYRRFSLIKGIHYLRPELIRPFFKENLAHFKWIPSSSHPLMISVIQPNKNEVQWLLMMEQVEAANELAEENMEEITRLNRELNSQKDDNQIALLETKMKQMEQRNNQTALLEARMGQMQLQQNAIAATSSIAFVAVALGLVFWAWRKLRGGKNKKEPKKNKLEPKKERLLEQPPADVVRDL